jgi:cytochrome c oxidase subunit IV
MSNHNSNHSNEQRHGYYTGDIHNQFVEEHHNPGNKKVIWRTFWILLAATIFEVGIAFAPIHKEILQWIFVVATIFKSAYIVGVFMHLGSEKKSMQYTILLPFILIVYFIAMCIAEGSYLHMVK